MASLKEIIELGKELGLEGDALKDFIKDEREKEEKTRQQDIEREERRLEREEKRRIEEMEMEKLKMQHELECKRVETEAKLKQNSKEPASYNLSKAIKMPKFDEKTDTMDAYIHRFEFIATNKNVDKKHWSFCLAENLCGSSLEVLQSMNKDDATDYEKLKNKLLERFKYNQEGYRKLFKSCKPKADENFDTYFDKLKQNLDKWITASEIEKGDYDKLRCLILFEQLYETCNPNLVRFLKERNPRTESELREHALLYEKANPATKLGNTETAAVGIERNPRQGNKHFGKNESRYRSSSNHESRRGAFQRPLYKNNYTDRGDYTDRGGYKDDQFANKNDPRDNFEMRGNNHFNNFRRDSGNVSNRSRSTYGRYYRGPPNNRYNGGYRRGFRGHYQDTRFGNVGLDTQERDPNNTNGQDANDTKDADGNPIHVSIMSAYASSLTDAPNLENMLLFDGKVNGNQVKVLRDTGANCNAVRRNLVRNNQMKDEKMHCKQFGGGYITIDIATVHIKTPFYTGWIRAAIVDDPIVDLTIGNDKSMDDKPLINALQEVSHKKETNI